MVAADFPKVDFAYRVAFSFSDLKAGQEIEVLSVVLSSDPRAPGGAGALTILCVDCQIALDRIHDKAVIESLATYLEEIGPIDHPSAFMRFQALHRLQNRRAQMEASTWREVVKEEILTRLTLERAKHPGTADKELVHEIVKSLRSEGIE